jgi:hypothetical protein
MLWQRVRARIADRRVVGLRDAKPDRKSDRPDRPTTPFIRAAQTLVASGSLAFSLMRVLVVVHRAGQSLSGASRSRRSVFLMTSSRQRLASDTAGFRGGAVVE